MPDRLDVQHEVTGIAARWLVGFVGSLTVLFVLPRLIRALVRHYAFRLIAEIVAIISFGLLAEKAVDWMADLERRPGRTD